MKLILTSPEIVLNTNSDIKDIVVNNLLALNNEKFEVVFISSDQSKLDKMSKSFQTLCIPTSVRQGYKLIDAIIKQNKEFSEYKDIIVLAGNDADCIMAFNNKLLLFSARWVIADEKNKKVFTYGIGLKSPDSLALISKQFLEMQNNPWFYKLQVNDKTTMYSLINANTYGKTDEDEGKKIIDIFQADLKEGEKTNRKHLIAYFLVSSHYGLDLRSVDFFSIYPSSSATQNEDLEVFKNKLRLQNNKKDCGHLLIRNSASPKRHYQGKASRINNGCDSQLDTIIINEKFEKKLKGKIVCIIDDFTTYGTSCETTRHLLEKAGVSKIIFITLGKFGREYYNYDYNITGNVFGNFKYSRTTDMPVQLQGKFNSSANIEMLKSLNYLVT